MIVTLGTPHNGDLTPEYVTSLIRLQNRLGNDGKVNLRVNLFETCLVHSGRNTIFNACEDDYLLFVDSDIVFDENSLYKLIESGKDIIGGLYHSRKPPHYPLAYTRNEKGKYDGIEKVPDDIFQVDAIATGFLLISKKVIDRFKKEKVNPFDFIRKDYEFELGEDMAFCERAKEYGFEIWADPSIPLLHVGKAYISRSDWMAYMESFK